MLAALVAGTASAFGSIQDPPVEVGTRAPSRETAEVEAPEAHDPGAQAVLERHLEAMGGSERRDEISSTRARAMLQMGETSTEFRLLTGERGKFLVLQTVPGLGEMEIGFDGESGWRRDSSDGRVTPITPLQAGMFLESFDFQALIRELDRRFTGGQVLPGEEIDSTPCDVLLVKDGDERLKLFFESEGGLARAIEVLEEGKGRGRRIIIENWAEGPGKFRWVRSLRIEQPRRTLMA